MSSILEQIKKSRPGLAMNTLKTYSSIIRNLASKLDIEINSPSDVNKNCDKIISFLKDKYNPKQRKTLLASLVVFLDKDHETTCNKLRAMMLKDIKTADKEDEERIGQMSEDEKKEWMSYDELKKKYLELEKEIKPLWKVQTLNKNQLLRLQLYTILSLIYGKGLSPRRSLDIVDLKYKNYNANEDNYYDKKRKMLIYNNYKTKNTYGKQEIPVPTALVKILNDWITISNNESDFVFRDTRGGKLNQTKLNTMLHNFFDRKISTTAIRHIFITNELKNIPDDVLQTAREMGHSVEQAVKYKR